MMKKKNTYIVCDVNVTVRVLKFLVFLLMKRAEDWWRSFSDPERTLPEGIPPHPLIADVTVISLTSMSIVFTGMCFDRWKGQKHCRSDWCVCVAISDGVSNNQHQIF